MTEMKDDPSLAKAAAELWYPHNQFDFVKRYLFNRLWLRDDAFKSGSRGEARFTDEAALWSAMGAGHLFETARLRLEDFYLMDWLPLEPGLYHTYDARRSRDDAPSEVIDERGGSFILSPYGKYSMVSGGIGCVRLAARQMFGDSYKLLTATSSGAAHEGFVAAVPIGMYSNVAEPIARDGAVRCTVVGELRRAAVAEAPGFSDQRTMVRVERLWRSRQRDDAIRLAATPLITFAVEQAEDATSGEAATLPEDRKALSRRAWFAYVTCDPRDPDAVGRGGNGFASTSRATRAAWSLTTTNGTRRRRLAHSAT